MNSSLELIIKVLGISTVIAIAIKYLIVDFPITATPTHALIGVFTPTIITAILLSWRMIKNSVE